jgi:alpha-galactosidase
MISEDSDLFRNHPDWALRVPGRKPTLGRSQMVLDLTRAEVADWLYDTFSGLLKRYHIEYIKWDMNRCMTDLYSNALPAERQGEVSHRFMLGLYHLIGRLTSEFPEVLFEGCAGGGGRFDAGMLAYFPQIWCSDNTDPVARLQIQAGSSFGYPVSAFGAHVSASPNHQTGRSTPIGTRAVVAMAGTFGYELDPGKLSDEEKQEISEQIQRYHSVEELIREGDWFRLTEEGNSRFTAWQSVSGDGEKSLLSLVITEPEGNPRPLHIRWKGLNPKRSYRLAWIQFYGCRYRVEEKIPKTLSGAALMYGGFTLPRMYGDYPSVQVLITGE